MDNLIWWLIVGALAGWIAGTLMKGRGFGTIGNIIVGIAGALIGGWILSLTGISIGGGMLGSILSAVLGAVVLLFVVGLVKKE